MLGHPITKDNFLYVDLQRAQTCYRINATWVFWRENSIFITNSYSNMKSMLRTVLIDRPLQSSLSISCLCPVLHVILYFKSHHLFLKCLTDLTGEEVQRTAAIHLLNVACYYISSLEEQASPPLVLLEKVTELQFYTGAG